jgi:uncharacterized membrane protein
MPVRLFLVATALGSAWITRESVPYFFGGRIHPFLLEKIESGVLASAATWITALHVHVVAAVFALPACLALTLRSLQRRLPRVHRWLGRITAVAVLIALVPSGSYLALWAKGGAFSTTGFLVSGAITAFAMIQAVRAARARDFAAHRRYSAHVLAQLSVAVTSRALLVAFDRAAVDAELAYLVALWVPVVGGALVVERFTSSKRRTRHVPRLHLLARDPAH